MNCQILKKLFNLEHFLELKIEKVSFDSFRRNTFKREMFITWYRIAHQLQHSLVLSTIHNF